MPPNELLRNTGCLLEDPSGPVEPDSALSFATPLSLQDVVLDHPQPRDQGHLRCCVSAATVAAMECCYRYLGQPRQLSVMFHYRLATNGANAELSLTQGPAIASARGVCRQTFHSELFTDAGLAVPITPHAEADARLHRIKFDAEQNLAWRSIFPSPNEILGQLSQRLPVVCAIWQTQGYASILRGAPIYGPDLGAALPLLHAVVVVGFSAERQQFLVLDSRGCEIGDSGRWWLPQAMVSAVVRSAFSIFGVTHV